MLESRPAAVQQISAREAELTRPHKAPIPEPEPEVDLRQLKPSDCKPLVQWQEILEECGKRNPAVLGTLQGSHASVCKNVIFVVAENDFFLTMFKEKANAISLGDAVEHVMGKRYAIRVKCSKAAAQPNAAEELLKKAQNSGIKTTAVT